MTINLSIKSPLSSAEEMTKILIIEDEDAIRENIAEMLNVYGYWVETAANGRDGISQALIFKPDLILCDIMMPQMDGYQVLEALRNSGTHANTPFIFLTSMATPTDIRKGMLQGADDYMTKPFKFPELVEAIEGRLNREKIRKEELKAKINEQLFNLNKLSTHEYNTPLGSMIGFLHLLTDHYSSFEKEEILSMLEMITYSSIRLKKTLDNNQLHLVLQKLEPSNSWYNQYTEGTSTLHQNQVQKLVAELAHQHELNTTHINPFKVFIEDACLAISEKNLMKVLEELIENAFKFSNESTEIMVIGIKSNDKYTLTITNWGREFKMENISKIGPYVQFERELYEQQGMGLGLWIARELLILNNGQLEIYSNDGLTSSIITLKLSNT